MNDAHVGLIAETLGIGNSQVQAVAALLEEGATVPFIARYRKEATGSLDEVAVSFIRDRLAQLHDDRIQFVNAFKRIKLQRLSRDWRSFGFLGHVHRVSVSNSIPECGSPPFPKSVSRRCPPWRLMSRFRSVTARAERGLLDSDKQLIIARQSRVAPEWLGFRCSGGWILKHEPFRR